ncbi:MAG: NAD-dependent epimerase/dehydratase family protein [Pseudomonadota bacterium]
MKAFEPRRILVLGTGGMIGNATVRELTRAGHRVVCVSRTAQPGAPTDVRHILADRTDTQTIGTVVEREAIDCVIDVLAYAAETTTPLLELLEGRVERYVLISSSDVYAAYGAIHGLEPQPVWDGPITERAPLRTSRFPYRGAQPRAVDADDAWMDAYDKIPIETAVRAMQTPWTILRLPMVFGPNDRQRRFEWMAAPMRAGANAIEAPAAWLDWVTTYGFEENVGAAIALAAAHPEAAREVFNVVDFAPVSHRQWIARLADHFRWSGEVRTSQGEDGALAKAVSRLNLAVPLDMSGERLSQRLGFVPPVSIGEAIVRTFA